MAQDRPLALLHARLIDGTGSPPLDDIAIVLSDALITAVGPTRTIEIPPDARTIDVAGRTVTPGLIDAHLHLSAWTEPLPPVDPRELTPELRAYGLAVIARALLEGGITTVRDAGQYGTSLFALRMAIALGILRGPRLVLAGQIVAATSPGANDFPGMYREANGPDDMRKAVREQVRQGADFIKVMATGALTVPMESVEPAQLTHEELAAVVDEAHRMGRKVAAHAEGVDGIRLAVAVGVDTIEHGELASSEPTVLDAMAEKGIVLVPTLTLFDRERWLSSRHPVWMRERAARLGDAARQTVRLALDAGVEIAMGADAGPYGASANELVALVDAGLSPDEAIVAGTRSSACACGLSEQLGQVRAGFSADLLILDENPLSDISVLTRPDLRWLVIHDGDPVAGAALPSLAPRIA